MEIIPHKILVIDDQIGKASSPEHADFLEAVGCHLNAGSKKKTSSYPYEFIFHTGQTEGRANSVEAVLEKVRERWLEQDGSRWKARDGSHWALILLDVQFDQKPAGRNDLTFGFILLNALRREFGPDLPIVMMTADTAESRRQMANYGEADGFLGKQQLTRENLAQRLGVMGLIEDDRPNEQRLVGRSIELLKVLREARRFALDPRGSRVIYGETGSGKTALANYVAHHCNRDGKLITWMAQPANDELNRDQLFGHWAGAFTGADTSDPGAIERAHEGVFLLDEVADLTPAAQQLLLEFRRRDEQGMRRLTRLGNFPTQSRARDFNAVNQALQSLRGMAYDAQGGRVNTPPRTQTTSEIDHIRVDVVLLFATNKPLWNEAFRRKEVRFREDLFVELGTPIFFPSLNQRKEDVGLLFRHFLARFLPNKTPTIHQDVIDLLEAKHDWTNRNVADLIRIAEYTAFAFGRDFSEVLKHHLPPDVKYEAEHGQRAANSEETAIPSAVQPTNTPSSVPVAAANTSMDEDTRCALAQNEYARLRNGVRLLARALDETVDREEATGDLQDYSPKRAFERLLGIDVTTTEAKRLVGEIIGSVLDPKDSFERALAPRGLPQCQEEIKASIVLILWYQWACEVKGFSDDAINQKLREYFHFSQTEDGRSTMLRREQECLNREIELRLLKRRKGKRHNHQGMNDEKTTGNP